VNDDDFAELFKKLPSGESTGSSWQDVVDELAALGKTFAEVARRVLQSTETDASLGQVREMMSGAIDELNRTVDGSPEAVQAREQLVQVRDTLREAIDRASSELRPELLNMLRQANAELRKLSGLDDQA
jgi:hypothetical protein